MIEIDFKPFIPCAQCRELMGDHFDDKCPFAPTQFVAMQMVLPVMRDLTEKHVENIRKQVPGRLTDGTPRITSAYTHLNKGGFSWVIEVGSVVSSLGLRYDE